MKNNIKYTIPLLLFIAVVSACHKVDVTPNSLYTDAIFPKTADQFQSVIGPIYTSLRGHFSGSYWFVQECSTDEAILPAYGGNWYDGAKYRELHQHTWTKDNAWVNSDWADATGLVGLCNQTLYIFRNAAEGDVKNTSLAEVKTMRAYA